MAAYSISAAVFNGYCFGILCIGTHFDVHNIICRVMGCVYMELYQFLMEYLHTYNIFSIIFLKILTNVKGDKALGAQKNGGKGFTLRQKMVFIMLPVIIIFNLITFIITVTQTRKIMRDNADEHIREVATSVGHQISADVMMTKGLLQNVKNSVEKSCANEEEIHDYIYSVADIYTDIIPAGIYCGLESGTYIDKMWTPDDPSWVMKERPWYVDGLKADNVEFGEMYLDANTNQYIISAFSNIKDSSGNALDDCRQMIEIAEQFNREGTEVENSGRELKELSLKLDETVEKFRV